MKRYILTLLVAIVALASQAQNAVVKGQVISAFDQEPAIGVTVKVKGTASGTVTDFNGNYTIQADRNATLVFSAIGYKTVEEAKEIRVYDYLRDNYKGDCEFPSWQAVSQKRKELHAQGSIDQEMKDAFAKKLEEQPVHVAQMATMPVSQAMS